MEDQGKRLRFGGVLKRTIAIHSGRGVIRWQKGDFVEIPYNEKTPRGYAVTFARNGLSVIIRFSLWMEFRALVDTCVGDASNGVEATSFVPESEVHIET